MLTTESLPGLEQMNCLALEDEDIPLYRGRLEAIAADLRPRTVLEHMLAQYIAVSSQRICRFVCLETAIVNWQNETQYVEGKHDPATFAALAHRALADNSRCLDLLGRSETRAFVAFENAINLLLKIRKELSPEAPERTSK